MDNRLRYATLIIESLNGGAGKIFRNVYSLTEFLNVIDGIFPGTKFTYTDTGVPKCLSIGNGVINVQVKRYNVF